MPKLTVVVSQGQSANPAKRALEEGIVAALLFEQGVEVTVVPNLYDLDPDGTGMLCLQGITGDMAVCSWLFPRAAHWVLSRNGIKGQVGQTLIETGEEEDDEEFEEEAGAEAAEEAATPSRRIYCLDLRTPGKVEAYVEEIRRIVAESSVQTVDLMGFIGGSPNGEQLQRYLQPAPGNVEAPINVGGAPAAVSPSPTNGTPAASATRVEEETNRRWYPVIDFSRCTNCLECLDFCLFGVYGVDRADAILVEQPDNCRKGCPACSRVCPENAIIFPQHKTPAIAGAAGGDNAAFKIDLSKLFGAPQDELKTAAAERDEQLMLAGRDAVGMTVGMPKRQQGNEKGPADELDDLIDELDDLDL